MSEDTAKVLALWLQHLAITARLSAVALGATVLGYTFAWLTSYMG